MVQILKVLSLVKHHNWNQVGLSTCQLQGVHAIATHWSTPPSSVPSEASLVLTLSLSHTHSHFLARPSHWNQTSSSWTWNRNACAAGNFSPLFCSSSPHGLPLPIYHDTISSSPRAPSVLQFLSFTSTYSAATFSGFVHLPLAGLSCHIVSSAHQCTALPLTLLPVCIPCMHRSTTTPLGFGRFGCGACRIMGAGRSPAHIMRLLFSNHQWPCIDR